MTITLWRTMQGVKDETLIATILSQVKSGELSMEEMCSELEKCVWKGALWGSCRHRRPNGRGHSCP